MKSQIKNMRDYHSQSCSQKRHNFIILQIPDYLAHLALHIDFSRFWTTFTHVNVVQAEKRTTFTLVNVVPIGNRAKSGPHLQFHL